jgi:hypothetical protein
MIDANGAFDLLTLFGQTNKGAATAVHPSIAYVRDQ